MCVCVFFDIKRMTKNNGGEGRGGGGGGGGRASRYSIGLPNYGLHKNSLKNLSKVCAFEERKHTWLLKDFSKNISTRIRAVLVG